MASIYAMSDMHGDMGAFERSLAVVNLEDPANMLILCGDYLPAPDADGTVSLVMIEAIMRLEAEHPGQVISLVGNHELAYMEERTSVPSSKSAALAWMRKLPYVYETESQIFVHAGVDEEAGDLWKWGSEDAYFCEKFPWSTGSFIKDVIAGHIGTSTIAADPAFHDIYWDGESHYYLDGTVQVSHHIPVLRYDIDARVYTGYRFAAHGEPEEYELQAGSSEALTSVAE